MSPKKPDQSAWFCFAPGWLGGRRTAPPTRITAGWLLAVGGMLTVVATGSTPAVHAQLPAEADGGEAKTAADSAESWPLPRGDAQSTGYTPTQLPTDLKVLWEYDAGEAIETTPVVADGRLFVADVMGGLYAIGAADGKEIWKKNYDTGFLASPSVSGDLLVIGDIEGNLYGIDAAKGVELWKQTTEGEINGAAAFYKSNVLVTSQDGKLYCFDAKDGTPVWTYQTNDQIRCNPTLAGDRTFLGGCDGQLHVVNLETGQADGEPLPLGGPTGSTPAVLGDRAYLPIMDGVILAFDWQNRKQLWEHEDAERAQEYRGSAAVSDQTVVVSSQFRQVDGLDAKTGEQKWRYTLKRRADASPVIAGDDVWIASTDGRLIRLSLAEGEERWVYEVRGAFYGSPAIASGRLYIADDEGVVRCFAGAN